MSANPSASITVPADASFNLHGYSTATVTYPVTDSGNVPINVTAYTATISPKARAHPAASWVHLITPAHLHLRAHQEGFLTLHIRVPRGNLAGAHFLNVIVRAAPLNHAGSAAESAAVGGTLKLTHPGHVALAHLMPAASPGSSPWPLLAGIGAVVVVLIAGAFWLRSRRRARHA